jgi:signal transduction histidine kinase
VWAWSFAVWLAVWALFTIQSYLYFQSRSQPLPASKPISAFVEWMVWALLTPGLLAYVWRRPITRGDWRQSVAWQVLGAVLGPALVVVPLRFSRYLLSEALDIPDPYLAMSPSFFFQLWVNVFLTYLDVVLVGHAIYYARESHDRELRTSKLEARLAEAQLQVLRLQLHPHFLFNTLHTISALMHKDLKAADRMLALLGDLLRDSFEKVGAQEVTLKQELGFLDRYLEIERTRFRDRLTVVFDVDPQTLDAEIPNLILQPLVENAIRHGIGRRHEAGRIEIVARVDNGRLDLRIRDDGPGIRAPRETALRTGVGLANTQARLQQLYGLGHQFDLRNRPEGGLEVALELPYRVRTEPRPAPASDAAPPSGAPALAGPAPLASPHH